MNHHNLREPDLRRAERTAGDIISEFGFKNPPIDPVLIARDMGVHVTFVKFDREHNNVSGYYDPEVDEIVVNTDDSPRRQTFTVAHELGHRQMHREWAASEDYRVLLRSGGRHADPNEVEADEFAGCLLMPAFLMDVYQAHSKDELARLFAVSIPAVAVRLSRLKGRR